MQLIYMIACADAYQHKVIAPSPEWAIKIWLDQQGYDSLEEAAKENYCLADEIKAILMGPIIEGE